MKAEVENLDIWRIEDSLYCKRSDGHLTRIQSDRTDILVKILANIRECGEILPPDDEDISPAVFSQIVRFFLDNGIIREAKESPDGGHTRIIGFFGQDDVFKELPVMLKSQGIILKFKKVSKASQLNGIHLLLVIAPVFDNFRQLKELSDSCYRKGLPLLYSSFGPTTFTIGPLCIKSIDTPSLNCYIKRRAVNLKAPGEYAEFIRSDNKEQIETARMTAFPYFEAGMNILRREINRFFLHHGKLSYPLTGKSYTYDFTRFSVEESLVLKDPLSPLFTPNAPFTPFNG